MIRFFLTFLIAFYFASCSSLSTKQGVYQSGSASWYGKRFHGRTTANGEKYNMHAMTAAHKSLPFGTKVKVISRTSSRFVVVRINDRGPFAKRRIIDLSYAAAKKLGFINKGHETVDLQILN